MRFMAIVGRLAFACFLIALVVGLTASFGTRLHLWDVRVGLWRIFPFCLYFGFAGIALGLLWGITALLRNSGVAARFGATGLVGSLIVLAVPLHDIYLVEIARAIPPIHDISTDTEHPPPFFAVPPDRAGAPNAPTYDGAQKVEGPDGRIETTTALQKKYYSDIRTAGVLIPPAKLYARALAAANAMGWRIVKAERSKSGGRIEATDTTFFFGLTDDIVIRVEPAGNYSRLDIRSKSRFGTTDFGANADRIRAYAKKLASLG